MMDQTVAIWLFGGFAVAIAGAWGFAWRAHAATAQYRDELYTYKLHVAEYYTSLLHTTALESRTVTALNEIKESLKSQNIKIDRLIERRVST